jgi:sortase A
MAKGRNPDRASAEELERLLHIRRWEERQQRLERLRQEGRLVEAEGRPAPAPVRPPHDGPARPGAHPDREAAEARHRRPGRWRAKADRLLLAVELACLAGLAILGARVWQASQELNREIDRAQDAASASVVEPTATAGPLIGVVVLPSGHRPPAAGRPPEPGEMGEIPAHLLPVIDAYVPPPIPTPGPEQARRLQIPAIGVDKPIVQGDDWEQLKKGVGQHVGSGLPGQPGNLVLSAHNDVYGEIFRHLDQLRPGDEIIVTSERRSYTYVVRATEVVAPTDTWVIEPTAHSGVTLISCYPYLIDTRRIVVFGDLASPSVPAESPS